MSNNRTIVTGRGGVGNVRKAPLKLDVSSGSHPQTAAILAQHEAMEQEYEQQILKRHKELKANTPRPSGRGGVGNMTETNPKSPTKVMRRGSLFPGTGAGITPLSPTDELLDMNVYDETERRKYAQDRMGRRQSQQGSMLTLDTRTSGGDSSLSPDSEYAESLSDRGSHSSMSIHTTSTGSAPTSVSESPTSSTSSKDKKKISSLWRKVSKSSLRPPRSSELDKDLLHRAEMAAAMPAPYDEQNHLRKYPNYVKDPAFTKKSHKVHAL